MTSWRTFLLNLAGFLVAIKILTDFVGAWLGEHHHLRVRSFFERWKAGLDQCSPNTLISVPLSALADIYERVLGQNPFSRQAFRRTCIFALLFLTASLGVYGLFCGQAFAMTMPPWKSFLASADYLRMLAANPSIQQQAGDPFFLAQNSAYLAKLGSWPFALLFTIYFVAVVVIATAFLVSLSVAVSRLFLQEMISNPTRFRVFVLSLSSTILLFVFGAMASFLLFVLLNLWTWPFLPMISALSKASFILGAGAVSAASLGSWSFSAPWLRIVVTLALFPSILLAAVISVATLAFPFNRGLHSAATWILRLSLRSPKGMFSFFSASSAGLGFLLGALAAFSAWLARLSANVGAPTFLGIDSLVFAFALLALLLALAIGRANNCRRVGTTSLTTQSVLFLFFGTLCVVVFGFYIQAILECFVNVQSASVKLKDRTLVVPVVSAVVPGVLAAYFVVGSKIKNAGWLRSAVPIFIALAGFDLLSAVRGLGSFHDAFLSVFFDLLGAPVAALVIFYSCDLLFPHGVATTPEAHPDTTE